MFLNNNYLKQHRWQNKVVYGIWFCFIFITACANTKPLVDETNAYRVSLWNEVPQLSRESGPPGLSGISGTTGVTAEAGGEDINYDRISPLADYGRSLLENIFKTCRFCAEASGDGGGQSGSSSGDNSDDDLDAGGTGRAGALVYRLGWVPFREAPQRSADVQLFIQVLYKTTEYPRGTALLFHGYANDSSYMTGVAGALLNRNWAVVLVDLPGHGLSTGPRGDVTTFSDYGDMVQTVLDQVLPLFSDELPEPLIAFGHSTGALALVDYSIRYPNRFTRMVFYAPLIRPVWWHMARLGRWVLGPFVQKTRAFAKSPLGLRVFPVHWFDELVRWNIWAQKQTAIPLPPTRIIQPVHDRVVESTYNARFIQQRAVETDLIRIDGLSHFATDSRVPDSRLLEAIVSYFE
ncbi:alpha/beta hydrolase [Gracilinema caldarium]|uniref:Alpha/beta hydrolase fold protein n=1 Tax=Gracilinema caldarium (strain ATCC 51460 / DSM 7334 / H1) TaxID=744872 RepID=F8F4C7_GRAC1|nr:alpha/beta fold hydrolase [Gracilinema caldarium]AEJ20574.1 alpha/beta hydrolase fold protein [Gracilinema caldarium DSM 7334]